MKSWFQEDLAQRQGELDATLNGINKFKELQKEQFQDRTDKEVAQLKMKAKKVGKAPVDEGTSSTSLQIQIKKKTKPKKNEPSRQDKSSRYVRQFNGYCFSCNFWHCDTSVVLDGNSHR